MLHVRLYNTVTGNMQLLVLLTDKYRSAKFSCLSKMLHVMRSKLKIAC